MVGAVLEMLVHEFHLLDLLTLNTCLVNTDVGLDRMVDVVADVVVTLVLSHIPVPPPISAIIYVRSALLEIAFWLSYLYSCQGEVIIPCVCRLFVTHLW